MKLRVARHTDRLDEVVAFYRDRIGLAEIGRFTDHAGYDGVFLGIPGTGTHLEFTAGGHHVAPAPHPESLLVLYYETQQDLDAVAARVRASEVTPVNPYWQRRARAFADPDGHQVLLTLGGSDDTAGRANAPIDLDHLRCSFCAKRHSDVDDMVCGPTPAVAICNECVDLCREIMDEQQAGRRGESRS